MKKQVFYLLVGMLAVSLVWVISTQFDFAQEKIVVVDSQKVLEQYNGFKEAKDIYELRLKELSDTFNKQRQIFESKSKELEILSAGLSKKEQTQKQSDLAKLKAELLKSGAAIESQSSQQENKLLTGVYNKVNDFIERFGERNGYEVILGANGQGNVIYVNDKTDITQEVINELNQEYVEGI